MPGIVVTGLGTLSPLGLNTPEFQQNLMRGTCGIGPISRFDASGFRVRVAAEVHGYNPDLHFPTAQQPRLDRFSQFAVVAAREAVAHAGLSLTSDLCERTGVVVGTGVGGQESQEEGYRRLYGEGATRLHPMTVPRLMPSAAASHVSIDLGISGPTMGTVSACASAGHALCVGALMLRAGLVDVVLTGGAEACLTPGTLRAWESLRVMASDVCRPFSRDRGGMVLGEGAAVLVLEREDHARARGARVHARLAGIGMSADAHDLVVPSSDGMGRAMRAALHDAGVTPGQVDYINAHGTGTAQNDPLETRAIHEVFGSVASRLAISSTKSMCGHLLGASAGLEAVATVLAITSATAPPTIGYLGPDPNCDLDYVPNEARPLPIGVALSNSFAFGGLNCVLVFSRE